MWQKVNWTGSTRDLLMNRNSLKFVVLGTYIADGWWEDCPAGDESIGVGLAGAIK